MPAAKAQGSKSNSSNSSSSSWHVCAQVGQRCYNVWSSTSSYHVVGTGLIDTGGYKWVSVGTSKNDRC